MYDTVIIIQIIRSAIYQKLVTSLKQIDDNVQQKKCVNNN